MRSALTDPRLRGIDHDGVDAAIVMAMIAAEKRFLRRLRTEQSQVVKSHLPPTGTIVEIGAGASPLLVIPSKDRDGPIMTMDIRHLPTNSITASALMLPFANMSISALVMVDVLHHLQEPAQFLREAERVLQVGGRLIMIEPWISWLSRVINRHLHPEPCDPRASWNTGRRPMTDANSAIPWIIFERDKGLSATLTPHFGAPKVVPMMPLAYLVSGGVSTRVDPPGWTYPLVRWLERLPWIRRGASQALIVLERQ